LQDVPFAKEIATRAELCIRIRVVLVVENGDTNLGLDLRIDSEDEILHSVIRVLTFAIS